MKRIIAIILLFCSVATVYGMDEKSEKINAIKKNADYVYGEATMQTQEEAISHAYDILQKEIIGWAQRENLKLSVTSASEINSLADTIITRRANMYRVFAYVKKSNLVSSTESKQPVVKQQPQDSMVTDDVKQVIRQRFGGQKENDALYRIKKAKNFFELKEIMQPLKEEGKIIDYGKYSTAEHVEQCYLIIYDPAGNIRALLGKGNDIRPNLKTGQNDSERNYRGCGAIWFKLKE